MLLAQALIRILQKWDAKLLRRLPRTLIRDRVIVVLMQLINRFLIKPPSPLASEDRQYPECVACEILACSALRSLPCSQSILEQLNEKIESGRYHLSAEEDKWATEQYLWIEKVTYGSKALSTSYCLAALFVTPNPINWNEELTELFNTLRQSCLKLCNFFASIYDQKIRR